MRVLLLAVARLNLDAIGDYAAAGGTNDVSHLETWPAHFFSAAFGCSPRDRFTWSTGSDQGSRPFHKIAPTKRRTVA